MLIMFVAILMILGGTLCGIEEEAVAFYPVPRSNIYCAWI